VLAVHLGDERQGQSEDLVAVVVHGTAGAIITQSANLIDGGGPHHASQALVAVGTGEVARTR
jgi:hypothetical protein